MEICLMMHSIWFKGIMLVEIVVIFRWKCENICSLLIEIFIFFPLCIKKEGNLSERFYLVQLIDMQRLYKGFLVIFCFLDLFRATRLWCQVMSIKIWFQKQKSSLSLKVRKMMKCICSGEQFRVDEIIPSSESLATRDYSASGFSSRAGDADTKADTSNIEEAESSLRESGFLNYEVGEKWYAKLVNPFKFMVCCLDLLIFAWKPCWVNICVVVLHIELLLDEANWHICVSVFVQCTRLIWCLMRGFWTLLHFSVDLSSNVHFALCFTSCS